MYTSAGGGMSSGRCARVGTKPLLFGAGVVGNQWLLPKLKQLPERRLSAEAVQQRLLAQHSTLAERITGASCPLHDPWWTPHP